MAAATLTAGATDVDFSYNPNPDTDTFKVFGYNKKETYDVAIRITNPALVGARITSLRVFIPVEEGWVSNPSGWLSTELKVENKVNVADITSAPATIKDRMLTVTFDEPYTFTAEGVYAGYSFTVDELADYSTSPIAGVEGYDADGLYVHSSRTRLKWMSEVESHSLVSPMIVTFRTDGGPTDVGVALPAEIYSVTDKGGNASATLVNYGSETLNSITYSWSCDESSGTGASTLTTPLRPGESGSVEVEVGPVPFIGEKPFTLTIDTFNGQPNADPRKTATTTMVAMPFMPVNRPLVEEYTGLRCQYCPRGYVAMEEMSRKYGDRFVGLAYHTASFETGCMVVMPDAKFPVSAPGYPYGTLNRSFGEDPSLLPSRWDEMAATVAPADIDVTIDWADDAHTSVTAKADVRFARSIENTDMNVALYLVADGLTNPEWWQQNAFAGDTSCTGELWEVFVNGGKQVYGLTFNDVVAYCTDTRGESGLIPASVTPETVVSYSQTVALADIINLRKEQFLSAGSSLRAVAVLIDNSNGYAVNANKSTPVSIGTDGIGSVTDGDSTIVGTEYYTLTGVRIERPAAGQPVIRIDRRSDGSVTHTKIMNTH